MTLQAARCHLNCSCPSPICPISSAQQGLPFTRAWGFCCRPFCHHCLCCAILLTAVYAVLAASVPSVCPPCSTYRQPSSLYPFSLLFPQSPSPPLMTNHPITPHPQKQAGPLCLCLHLACLHRIRVGCHPLPWTWQPSPTPQLMDVSSAPCLRSTTEAHGQSRWAWPGSLESPGATCII